ncbi:retrovirus-related pol polyprotein from transposon TNT 1-94 [Tanacetum coccineum]
MLRSIDCMYWEWTNCPRYLTWSTQRTLKLEVVAAYKLWIWHAYFGVPRVARIGRCDDVGNLAIESSPRVGQALLQQLVRTETGAEYTIEGRKQNKSKLKSWKIGEIKYKQNITCWNCNQNCHFQNQCSKLVATKDKEVNIATGDSYDALVCCVKNTVEDLIMDSGASFHATYCKEELERFKLCSGKDVRYIPGLKIRLISIGHLNEEGYHAGFGVLKQYEDHNTMILLSKTATAVVVDSLSTSYLIYRIPYVLIGLRIPKEECDSDKLRYSFQDMKSHQRSEITQSPCRSSDTSERSKNSGSFEDSGRSDEEDSEDGASSKEGGSETPQMKDRFSEKHVLGYVFTVGVTTVKWESRLQKSVTMSTIEAK